MAQVEVAVEITMETTTSMQRPEKTSISSARPLISRVLLPDSADSSTSMLYKHRETGEHTTRSGPSSLHTAGASLDITLSWIHAQTLQDTRDSLAECKPELSDRVWAWEPYLCEHADADKIHIAAPYRCLLLMATRGQHDAQSETNEVHTVDDSA